MSLYNIDVKELTDDVVISSDNEVSGSGIFDTLMVTVSKHIEAQYREGRILGTEYSTVYLGALQAVLDLSTKILLEKDLIAKQAEEIDSRISVNNKQIEKLTSDIFIAEEQSEKDLALKETQISKLASEETNDTQRTANDTSRTTAEVSLKGSQKTLVDQQKLTEAEKTDLVDAQKVGFEVDFRLKHAKLLWDSWSVGFSVAQDALGTEDTDTLTLLNKTNVQNAMINLEDAINRFPSSV